MPNAQDEAFVVLARRRGMLTSEQLEAAEGLRADVGVDEPVAQRVLEGRLLPPAAVTVLLRDLTRGHFACERCAERVGYDLLSRFDRLACPRCGGPLGFVEPSSSDLGTDPSRPTGVHPAVSRGTGAYPAMGASTGNHPAVSRPTGAHTAVGGFRATGRLGPATGAHPAVPARVTGTQSLVVPSLGDTAPAGPAAPVPPPDTWDAEATVIDRKKRRPGSVADGAPVSANVRPSGGLPTVVPSGVFPAVLPPESAGAGPSDPAESTLRDVREPADSTRRDARVIGLPGGQRTIGPYVLVSELGRGTGGVIFLARRPGLERRFAVKVLLGEALPDEAAVKRFQLEAAVASKIDDPGIVAVFDTGSDGGRYYYAMEYCPGPTLEARLASGPMSPTEAARLVLALARTVQAAHDKGVIHRDLKPANVILEETTGRPRVTDFGVARDVSLGRALSRTGELLGTPNYMAPEQLLGERTIDARVDVFALGVILFECISGRRPHVAATTVMLAEKVVHEDAPALRSVAPDAPAGLETICRRALTRDRAARYGSARSLARDLERFLAGRSVDPRPAREAARAWTLPVLVGTAAAALALAGIAIGWSGGRPTGPSAEELLRREQAEAAATLAARTAERLAALRVGLHDRSVPLADVRGEVAALARSPGASADVVALAAALEAIAGAHAGDRSSADILRPLQVAISATHTDTRLLAELHLAAAEHLRRRARHTDALTHAELALAEQGRLGREARFLRALLLRQLERGRESQEPLEALERDDREGVVGLLAAAMRLTTERPEEAVQLAQRADVLEPGLPWVTLRLGSALLHAKRHDEALLVLDTYLKAAPDDQHGHLLRGVALTELGRVDDALVALDRAVALGEPDPDPQTLRMRAEHLANLGQGGRAIDDLDRSVRARPEASSFFLRGRLHEAIGRTGQAEADWRQAHALDAPYVEQLIRSLPAAQRKRMRQALGQDFEEEGTGIRLGEVTPELMTLLGARADRAPADARAPLRDALVRAARAKPFEEVVSRLDAATAAGPDSLAVALERAQLLAMRDVYGKAREAIERARALSGPPHLLDRLEAEVSLRQGQLTEAERRYRALAERDPQGVEGACALAEAERLVGNVPRALEAAEFALQLDPGHTAALAVKGELLLDLEPPNVKGALEVATRGMALVGWSDSRLAVLRFRCTAPAALREMRETREDEGQRGIDLGNAVGARFRMLAGLQEFKTMERMSEGAGVSLGTARICLETKSPIVRSWARDMLAKAKSREPDRAELELMIGRYELLLGLGTAERILERWRRARELDPLARIPAEYLVEFRQEYGERPGLDALIGEQGRGPDRGQDHGGR